MYYLFKNNYTNLKNFIMALEEIQSSFALAIKGPEDLVPGFFPFYPYLMSFM